MFERASVRLTGLYLLIIMSISLIFSLGLYQLAASEIEQSVRRPSSFVNILQLNDLEGLQDFLRGQDKAVADAKSNIRFSLYMINLFIFITGGLLSYYLARRSLRPIEKAHEAQSRFTSDASHELRTPIAAMRLENEITMTDPKLTLKKAKHQFESNIEELDKLTVLTEGLLQLSRLENEGLSKTKTTSTIVIKEALSRSQNELTAKKQKISWKQRNLPFTANEETITQAVSILISNASKFSPENSTITITASSSNNQLTISVKDRGVGIHKEEIGKIFDRFYRSDLSRTKNATEGYGIGLSIAQKIVKLHGGSIQVSSVVDKGSTFSLIVPKS